MQALSELVQLAKSEIDSAANLTALDTIRVFYFGKKGALTIRLKELSQLPVDERPATGKKINLEDLTYWNVELQEAYFSYKEAHSKREGS